MSEEGQKRLPQLRRGAGLRGGHGAALLPADVTGKVRF